MEEIQETEEEDARKKENAQISFTDRLRFIEAMFQDEVKGLYQKSQDCLSAAELDARNSVLKVVNFYDKLVEIFNDESFQPESKRIPDLHEQFAAPIQLPLKVYCLTRDKAKDLLVNIRPKLAKMLHNYELSGNRYGQMRNENNGKYGHLIPANVLTAMITVHFY